MEALEETMKKGPKGKGEDDGNLGMSGFEGFDPRTRSRRHGRFRSQF